LWTGGWRVRLAEHQRVAAARVREVLQARGGVLLADGVGLGKSFVAAAVMQTFEGESEVIVPAALGGQWKSTLASAGVDARILTHDSLAGEPFVPDPSRRRLVVVDEAHAFRNPQTQRYDALGRRSIGADVLLVTATPICNSANDLHALLSLLVPDDALSDIGVASIDMAFASRDATALESVLSALVIRRDHRVLSEDLRFPTALRRVVRHPVFNGSGRVGPLIESLEFPLVGSAPLLRRLLWRRLESSEAALQESLRRQMRFYDRALDSLAHGRVLSKRDYRAAFGSGEDTDPIQQILFWDIFAPPAAGFSAVTIRREVERLDDLRALVAGSDNAKRQLLIGQLEMLEAPAIVFTAAAATARDLYEAVRPRWRSALATARDGHHGIEAFRTGSVDLLVTTDLASEGLNLQRAGAVVHYDIPWNPVKLDQRNGRACRIGQKRTEVIAIYFLPETDITGIIPTMVAKNRTRRRLVRAEAEVTVPSAATSCGGPSTLPPRVARDAAIVEFLSATKRMDLFVPAWLERRHKAGVERLLHAASREYLDRPRLDDLLAMIAAEHR
jgi:superfamily II DNA or RNA helicase